MAAAVTGRGTNCRRGRSVRAGWFILFFAVNFVSPRGSASATFASRRSSGWRSGGSGGGT